MISRGLVDIIAMDHARLSISATDKDNDVYIALPKIHESVFGRIDSGCNAYAPIILAAKRMSW